MNRNMQKILALFLLVVSSSLCFVGCGNLQNATTSSMSNTNNFETVPDKPTDTPTMKHQYSDITQDNSTKHHNIPKLSSFSHLLETNWDAFKIRKGQYLSGPKSSWNDIAASNLYLHNIDFVDCYFDTDTMSDIIGVVDSQIVFQGTYGLTQCPVKDLLSDDALTLNPYATYTANGNSAYIWELQNGFLMIVSFSSNSLDWYNQRAFCVVHAKSLDFFAPLETTNSNDTDIIITNKIEETGNTPQNISSPSLDPLYMWEGRDVFTTFFAAYFTNGSAIGWEHLGINGDYFTLPGESTPTWVDVYRVHTNDTRSDKYYIIPYGELQLTEVYESSNGTDTKLIWSIPLTDYYDWMQ